MRKTAIAATLISALMISALTTVSYDIFVSAQTNSITINTDGSVTPSTALIQRVGDSYLVTNDTDSIFIKRSNMTLDGQGHRIQGEIHLPVGSTQFTQVNEAGGIYISNTKNVTVKNFSIENCYFGVSLDNCSNITIYGLNITGTWNDLPFSTLAAGIFMWQSVYNNITGNRLDYNEYGVYLGEHSRHNTFVDNTIIGSSHIGIQFFDSSSNVFYHNNFDNEQNVYDNSLSPYSSASLSINAWDNSEEGNFWSDYNGTDANGDGIGDTPYTVNRKNTDNYPLIKPFNSTVYLQKTTPPKIAVLSPVNQVFNESSVPLVFAVDKQVNWVGYSLDGLDNMTITANSTMSGLTNGLHNVTLYAKDEFENIGASETIYFNVEAPEPFPTTLIIASIASVAVISIGLLVYFKKREH